MNFTDKVKAARGFAAIIHGEQRYGELPYTHHLDHVVRVLMRYGVVDRDLLAAGWLHDSREDTGVAHATLVDLFGERTANLVWAVSDEPGRNRAERKVKVYSKIRQDETGDSAFLKLADRVANVEHSVNAGNSRMFLMYRNEHPGFQQALRYEDDSPTTQRYQYGGRLEPLWHTLNNLFRLGDSKFDEAFKAPSVGKEG